ncbi:MAG TPA: ABC transporter permease [Clostridia bacterium]|nr:ABC transporter permease [Clostridia bacterium]
MITLVRNEIYKMILRKKVILIIILLILFVGLFSYGENYIYNQRINAFLQESNQSNYSWENIANQRLERLKENLESAYIPERGIKSIEIQIEQLEYFIDNNINPITPSVARFNVEFVKQSITFFLPLLIIIIGADLISGEFSEKTIKILLTRAVPRWKILMSKLIALLIMTTLIVLLMAIISTSISRVFINRLGFDEPVITGFKLVNGELSTATVIQITSLRYMLLNYSLAWYVALVMSAITFMISVLVKSMGSAIGIIMASLIGGQFLQFFLSDWGLVKYFYVTNLDLTKYLTGSYQQVEGMNLVFSVLVLMTWAIISILISFLVFSKKDVLV